MYAQKIKSGNLFSFSIITDEKNSFSTLENGKYFSILFKNG